MHLHTSVTINTNPIAPGAARVLFDYRFTRTNNVHRVAGA